MSIDSIAALGAAQSQQQVANQVGIRVLQLANQQQQSVLSLLDAAVESIEQTQPQTPGQGSVVDVTA